MYILLGRLTFCDMHPILNTRGNLCSSDQFYHWRKLPQVSFLSRQTFKGFVATNTCLVIREHKGKVFVAQLSSIIGGSCHKKYNFCRDKTSERQTRVLSRQMFCRGKHTFLATKMILVATPANDTVQFQMVSTRPEKPIYALHFSLGSFPNIAFETVPTFVTMRRRPFVAQRQ